MKTTVIAVAAISGLFVVAVGQQFVPGLGWSASRQTIGAAVQATPALPPVAATPLATPPRAAATTTDRPAAGPVRVAQATAPAAKPATTPAPVPPSTPATAATPPATSGASLRGEFHGADKAHKGEGTAEIVKTASGWEARLTRFSTTRGPDLEVWLVAHPDPKSQSDVTKSKYVSLGRLKSFSGDQSYALPAGVDPAEFKSLVIWCEDFSVLFASAPLSPRS